MPANGKRQIALGYGTDRRFKSIQMSPDNPFLYTYVTLACEIPTTSYLGTWSQSAPRQIGFKP